MFRRSTYALAASAMATCLLATPVTAQENGESSSILTAEETSGLVAEHADATADRRAALDAFLDEPAVREAAEGAGIDIRRVESAAATLSDTELERLEPRLRDAEEALAGGDTLVIGTTTIIIALLVIILIIVA